MTAIVWLVIGIVLCSIEMFAPTAYILFVMGLSAVLVAAIALLVPHLSLQMFLWILFSSGLVYLTRRFFPKKNRAIAPRRYGSHHHHRDPPRRYGASFVRGKFLAS